MSTTVTVKGQVTLPKAVRAAAGIRPGDRVEVRMTPAGEVLVEKLRPRPTQDMALVEAHTRQIEKAVADLHARGIKPTMSADEVMRLTRGDD